MQLLLAKRLQVEVTVVTEVRQEGDIKTSKARDVKSEQPEEERQKGFHRRVKALAAVLEGSKRGDFRREFDRTLRKAVKAVSL